MALTSSVSKNVVFWTNGIVKELEVTKEDSFETSTDQDIEL
jgi:hypothetical protein